MSAPVAPNAETGLGINGQPVSHFAADSGDIVVALTRSTSDATGSLSGA